MSGRVPGHADVRQGGPMTRRTAADSTTMSVLPLADFAILSQRPGLKQVDRLNPLHVALCLAIGEAMGQVGPTAAGLTALDFHSRALDELRGLATAGVTDRVWELSDLIQ